MNVPAECLASRRGAAQVPPDCARHIAAAPLSWLRLRVCALFCLVAARSKPELAYERGYGGAVGRPGLGDQPAPERLYGDRTPVRAAYDENGDNWCSRRVEPSFKRTQDARCWATTLCLWRPVQPALREPDGGLVGRFLYLRCC